MKIKTISLKHLLEDDKVTKLMWDVRSDNNALVFQFDIRIAGVVDLQLLEVAWRITCGATPATVGGLGWTLENTDRARLTSAQRSNMVRVKAAARALFAPEYVGSYSVWRRQPLPETLVQYCTDAHIFFSLRSFYASSERAHGAPLAAAVNLRLVVSSRRTYESMPPDLKRAVVRSWRGTSAPRCATHLKPLPRGRRLLLALRSQRPTPLHLCLQGWRGLLLSTVATTRETRTTPAIPIQMSGPMMSVSTGDRKATLTVKMPTVTSSVTPSMHMKRTTNGPVTDERILRGRTGLGLHKRCSSKCQRQDRGARARLNAEQNTD